MNADKLSAAKESIKWVLVVGLFLIFLLLKIGDTQSGLGGLGEMLIAFYIVTPLTIISVTVLSVRYMYLRQKLHTLTPHKKSSTKASKVTKRQMNATNVIIGIGMFILFLTFLWVFFGFLDNF